MKRVMSMQRPAYLHCAALDKECHLFLNAHAQKSKVRPLSDLTSLILASSGLTRTMPPLLRQIEHQLTLNVLLDQTKYSTRGVRSILCVIMDT